MEGYTNLSLIKEEDFNKHGVGHLHAKNASKRVYQTRRQMGGNNSERVPVLLSRNDYRPTSTGCGNARRVQTYG